MVYKKCLIYLASLSCFVHQVLLGSRPQCRINSTSSAIPESTRHHSQCDAPPLRASPSSPLQKLNYKVLVTEAQLDALMELDIMKAVTEMGFPIRSIKKALREKIEETGVPFFNLETCTEKVLMCNEQFSDEAEQQQEVKISNYQREREERIRQSHEESLANSTVTSQPASSSLTTESVSDLLDIPTPTLRPAPRTPIITSPVMPPRRTHANNTRGQTTLAPFDRDTSLHTTLQSHSIFNEERRQTHPDGSSIYDHVLDIVSVSSPTSMESEDILEYPLVRNVDDNVSAESSGDRDMTPTNDVSSDVMQNHIGITAISAETTDDVSSEVSRDAPVIDQPMETTVARSSVALPPAQPSTLSSSVTLADPVSMEMLNQVDEILEKQKRACRNLSNCSTSSQRSNCSTAQLSVGEEECAECSSSDEGNTSMSEGEPDHLEEALAKAKKEAAKDKKEGKDESFKSRSN